MGIFKRFSIHLRT